MKKFKNFFLFLLTFFLILIDRFSKKLIESLNLETPIVLIPNFFQIVKVYNTGIAFGFLSNVSPKVINPLIAGIGFVAIGWIMYLLIFEKQSFSIALSLHLLLAGAVGNVWDRFIYGAVLDFFDFKIGNYHWPAFNVSDSCITIGLILLLLDTLFIKKKNVS